MLAQPKPRTMEPRALMSARADPGGGAVSIATGWNEPVPGWELRPLRDPQNIPKVFGRIDGASAHRRTVERPRFGKPACGVGPNDSMSNWTCCKPNAARCCEESC